MFEILCETVWCCWWLGNCTPHLKYFFTHSNYYSSPIEKAVGILYKPPWAEYVLYSQFEVCKHTHSRSAFIVTSIMAPCSSAARLGLQSVFDTVGWGVRMCGMPWCRLVVNCDRCWVFPLSALCQEAGPHRKPEERMTRAPAVRNVLASSSQRKSMLIVKASTLTYRTGSRFFDITTMMYCRCKKSPGHFNRVYCSSLFPACSGWQGCVFGRAITEFIPGAGGVLERKMICVMLLYFPVQTIAEGPGMRIPAVSLTGTDMTSECDTADCWKGKFKSAITPEPNEMMLWDKEHQNMMMENESYYLQPSTWTIKSLR